MGSWTILLTDRSIVSAPGTPSRLDHSLTSNATFSPPIFDPSSIINLNDAACSNNMEQNESFKCIQWNARGLTKSELEEFKQFISSSSPDVVLISETHWSSAFDIQFRCYNVFKKDCPLRQGGGVALIVHKSILSSPLLNFSSDTAEAIGVSIISEDSGNIDIISVYFPKGSSDRPKVVAT